MKIRTLAAMSKPITLTNREIIRLRDGLDSLANGMVSKAGANTEIVRFELDDKLAWNVAKALDIADRAAGVYQKARKSLGAKLGVVERMALNDATAPKIAAFMEEEEKLLDKTQELTGILLLSRAAIQTTTKNAAGIAGVLRNIMPILTE